jgi:hypothetical protein
MVKKGCGIFPRHAFDDYFLSGLAASAARCPRISAMCSCAGQERAGSQPSRWGILNNYSDAAV